MAGEAHLREAVRVHPGFAEAWNSDKIRTLPGYNKDTKAKDIAEAQKMMAAAGHANGDGVSFLIQSGPGVGIRAAQAENSTRFQAQMKKVFPGMGVTIQVYPSGAAFATNSAPITDAAPARFSTTMGCPQRRDSSFDRARAMVSSGPPGGQGTTLRMGFAG